MSAGKNKNSAIISNLIIGLIILGFAYYKFVYSGKESVAKISKTENTSVGLKDSDMILDRRFSFSFFYLSDEDLRRLKKLSENLDKDLQLNGMMMDWNYLNYTTPADVKSGSEMDFKMDSFAGLVTNDSDKLTHEIIFKIKGCTVRPRLFVIKNSNYQKIDDLTGKKIVLIHIKEIPDVMYDFIAKSKLSAGEYYKNLKQYDVMKGLNSHTYDAILITENENRGKRVNSSRISEEELENSFREIAFNYPELPCRGIYASKKLDKKVVEKFISIQPLPREKDSIANWFFSSLERFSETDLQKIVMSFDWKKIEDIKQTTKDFVQAY